MKLTIIETPRPTKTFGELKPGDVFRWETGRFAKTVKLPDGWNAVGLEDWDHVNFAVDDEVEPLDAELIVRPLQQ